MVKILQVTTRNYRLWVITCLSFMIGTLYAVLAEENSDETSILFDAPELNATELLASAYKAQIDRDYPLALEYLEAAKVIAENASDKV